MYLFYVEEDMDGKAIAIGISTSPGPDWLKEIVKKVGIRLKVHRELRTLLLTTSAQNKGSELALETSPSPATPVTPRSTSPCTSNAVSFFFFYLTASTQLVVYTHVESCG